MNPIWANAHEVPGQGTQSTLREIMVIPGGSGKAFFPGWLKALATRIDLIYLTATSNAVVANGDCGDTG